MSKGKLASTATHVPFEREKPLVEYLLKRLKLGVIAISNPNTNAKQTGVDVLVHFVDGRTIGIQVTELDPHPSPGKARAQETRIAGATPAVYADWAQNNPQAYLDALVRAVNRKIAIAERHSFEGLDLTETWLLVCAGIPEHGATISTMVMTPWLHEHDIELATGSALQQSKYDRCFFLPILGTERAFYRWEKHSAWEKAVSLDDIHSVPRPAYMNNLLLAAAVDDQQEMDRLCDAEVSDTLREIREAKN